MTGYGSNYSTLMLGDQIPHPQEGKSGQMPEVYAQEKGEGGGGVEASILPVHY